MLALRRLAFVAIFATVVVGAGLSGLAALGPAFAELRGVPAFALTAAVLLGSATIIAGVLGAVALRLLVPTTRRLGLRQRAGRCALAVLLAGVPWAAVVFAGFATVVEATLVASLLAGLFALLLSRRAGG